MRFSLKSKKNTCFSLFALKILVLFFFLQKTSKETEIKKRFNFYRMYKAVFLGLIGLTIFSVTVRILILVKFEVFWSIYPYLIGNCRIYYYYYYKLFF